MADDATRKKNNKKNHVGSGISADERNEEKIQFRGKKEYLEQSGDGERLDFHLALVTPSDHKKTKALFLFRKYCDFFVYHFQLQVIAELTVIMKQSTRLIILSCKFS